MKNEKVFDKNVKVSTEKRKHVDKIRQQIKKQMRERRQKYTVSRPGPTPKVCLLSFTTMRIIQVCLQIWNESQHDYNKNESEKLQLHQQQQREKLKQERYRILKQKLRVQIFFTEPDGASHEVRYFHELPQEPNFDDMPVNTKKVRIIPKNLVYNLLVCL